jgi:fructose-1,6-bisphosphatase/inositol monophosphatase family enzyme
MPRPDRGGTTAGDDERLAFAGALAREAGRMAHAAFGRSTTTMKGRHDVVTEMDAALERHIRAAILRAFPGDAVIGEEEGGAASDRLWIVDPIDGTANYARGISATSTGGNLRSARSTTRRTTGSTRPRAATAHS